MVFDMDNENKSIDDAVKLVNLSVIAVPILVRYKLF